jgi:predicted AlkP superfamily phosphohydrolase/phosphomutase
VLSDSRVLLLGLDGAAFPTLQPLLDGGTMPFLASLLEVGARAPLASTPHPISPAAWASIITGRTPGQHGVFDFVRVGRSGNRLSYSLVTSADLRAETVFSRAARYGRTVTALNFPCMFPTPELPGNIVPGYVPWTYLARAVRPRGLFTHLKERAGLDPRKLAVDWELERTAVQGLPADELARWVQLHIDRERQWFAILRYLMLEEPTDLTAVVFDGVDRIQHLCLHLFPRAADEVIGTNGSTVKHLLVEYFQLLDDFLAEAVRLIGSDAHVFVVSDHGAETAGDRVFYANAWLAEHGYLRWKDAMPIDADGRLAMNGNTESALLFDWDATFAAALTSSSNAIHILRSTHTGEPGVTDEDYPAFRARLVGELVDATDPDTGEPIVDRVLLREQAFRGAVVDQAPDITLVLRSPGFLSVLPSREIVQPRRTPYGTHSPEGIFLLAGPGVRAGVERPRLAVHDVAACVVHALGLPVPHEWEGKPALDAYDDDWLRRHPMEMAQTVCDQDRPTVSSEIGLDEAGEAAVVERLRMLGYVE